MRALVCEKYGPVKDLRVKEIEAPKPGSKDVLIQVQSAAVNFPDTLIVQGLYQMKPEVPFVPGSDMAGIVIEVGEDVKHLKVGDEVLGFNRTGAFAERAVVPAAACVPKPAGMDFSTAASFLMAYGTSFHALKDRAKIQQGETLLILGASGGVGLAAIELGKQMGAKVIAAASTVEKLAICKEHGADEVVNYSEEDLKSRIKELTNGKGVDVIYDPVGGQYSEPALRRMAWNGRYLVVGFTTGTIPKIPLNLALLKGCAITGVFWGRFAMEEPKENAKNIMTLMGLFTSGKLNPHIHAKYPLQNALEALQEILDRKVSGKVLIEMS